MRRTETAPSATLLHFPAAAAGRSLAGLPGAPFREPSRREIERAIARGRRLQGLALRDGFSRLFGVLVGGCSLRHLRLPGAMNGALHGRRETCC